MPGVALKAPLSNWNPLERWNVCCSCVWLKHPKYTNKGPVRTGHPRRRGINTSVGLPRDGTRVALRGETLFAFNVNPSDPLNTLHLTTCSNK
eukprot:9503565-Pyramimonas_sp.AAC.1